MEGHTSRIRPASRREGEKVGNPPPYATKPTHLLNVCGLFEVYQIGHFFSSMADAQGERDRELQGSGGRPPHPPPEPEAKPFPKRPAQPQIPNRRGRKFYQPPGGPANSHAGSLSASGKGGMVSRPEKASFTGRGGGGRTPLPISSQTPTHLLVWEVYSNSKQPNFWLSIIIGPILDQANTRPWVQF